MKSEKVKVGDFVRFDCKPSIASDLTKGKKYEVLSVSGHGGFTILDDIGDECFCFQTNCFYINNGRWIICKK